MGDILDALRRTLLPWVTGTLAVVCFAYALSTCLHGCALWQATSSDPVAAAEGYELHQCTLNAKTWAEYLPCEHAIKAKYGRLPITDGGTDGSGDR